MPIEKWSESIAVVHLADDPQFTEDLQTLDALGETRLPHMVLDLSAVHFVNSSNIARLLKLRKRMITADAQLILCALSNQVWTALLMTGLDKVFTYTESVTMALATIQMKQ